MSRLLTSKFSKIIAISLIISTTASILLSVGFLDTWESKVSDALYYPSNPLDEIIIIAIDDDSLQDLGRWPWPRDYFAQVINTINQSAVIGIDISFFESTSQDTALADALTNSNVVLAMEYTSFSFKNGNIYGESLIKPNTTLGTFDIDYHAGFVNLYTDSDGVTRTFIPHIEGIEEHKHFSVVIAEQYLGIEQQLGSERRLINFFGLPGGYEYVSFSDVYHNKTNPSYFKNKIVLIGATANNLHDTAIVPISTEAMPGVEVNANLVQSIITKDFLFYQDSASAIIIIFIFSIITGLLFFHFRIHIATIIIGLIIIFYIISAIYIFDSGLILNILYPFFAIILTYITLVVMYYLTEERSRKWITSIFGKYVSPVVIENLIKNPNKINLGGEKRNISIFFSDIRGFTSISERLKPEELVSLLNEYLTEMTSIIIKNQGLVDKFMGDAIMAFWGAPLEEKNHEDLACTSSLQMIDKLKELQTKWKKENIPALNIGIGINSGEAIVGNMGSMDRFDYTAMGDNVNLASRLEGLNKYYSTNIIISEFTQKNISDKFITRKLDMVQVKGKEKPILIYELVATKETSNETLEEFIDQFEKSLELYFNKKWDQALESFTKAQKIKEDDATIVFINRCQQFIKNPPSKDWDGVWEMRTK